ncbi:hypothetical protein [Pectobacterium versatile]|uniref:hypothetical protein n=1 Tax=Pectobacterium versatile TaxID=2488639 RepID=UPI001CD17C48|nr:hypothetical protein [Pectobacterium versatile]
MVSAISHIGLNKSLYSISSEKGRNTIDGLLNAVSDQCTLNHRLKDGCTVRESLEALYALAKLNHRESIELLLNIAMGQGETASYTQQSLCKIVSRKDDAPYEAARTVREGCQNAIIDFNGKNLGFNANENPKIVFASGKKLSDDEDMAQTIPVAVQEEIQNLNDATIKPAWFEASENHYFDEQVKFDDILAKDDYLKYTLPSDGACQFRAMLMLRDNNTQWLHASKDEIAEAIPRNDVLTAIEHALNQLVDKAGMPIPRKFAAFFESENFASSIYQETIASGNFTLYSPEGINSSISNIKIAPDSEESTFLEIFADIIGKNINEIFQVETNPDSPAYATLKEVHYNVIAHKDQFSSSLSTNA